MLDHEHTQQLEIWKPAPEFEEWYSVSNLGRVRRDKSTSNSCAGTILKPIPQTAGYGAVQLFRGNKQRYCRLVHRLVAMAFIEPDVKWKMTVNHKDGNRLNNRADNLEWCTPLENARHAIEVLGRLPTMRNAPRGDNHYKRILTQAQVDEIRRQWGESGHRLNQSAVARTHGVSKKTINTMLHGGSWKRRAG
jgi:hypothetical protein